MLSIIVLGVEKMVQAFHATHVVGISMATIVQECTILFRRLISR